MSIMIPSHWPVIGICGYSGSGKTTLIERLVEALRVDGLAVAVVKHDAHSMTMDKTGKDTDRFFQAGATVFAHDPAQAFLRLPSRGGDMLYRALELLLHDHDIVIVEGHKHTAMPTKIWLRSASGEDVPPESCPVLFSLGRNDDRLTIAHQMIVAWLARQLHLKPLRAGLLVGGCSSRIGHPEQLIEHHYKTLAECAAEVLLAHIEELYLLGNGKLPKSLCGYPHLPDVPSAVGPVASMLAAMRWAPDSGWFFATCDMPLFRAEAIGWLLDQRAPGRWAVIPRHTESGNVEPLFAWYDSRMAATIQTSDCLIALAEHPNVFTPIIPADFLST